MRSGTRLSGIWFGVILTALSLTVSSAWAEAGKTEADRLCEKAERAELDAREAMKKSAERQKFLKTASGRELHTDTVQVRDTSAISQAINAKIIKAREILPQIRQGIAAANRDQGVVPGLGQYFAQMESTISRLIQAVDSCLDKPELCRVPSIPCPIPPQFPAFNNVGSANFVRNVQQSYSQAANQARQACQSLNSEALADIERFKQESRSAAAIGATKGGNQHQGFGDVDLQAKRAESLRHEALQHRQAADRLAGVNGYCSVRGSAPKTGDPHALVSALKTAKKNTRKPEEGTPPGATVVDLKAAWQQKWDKGKSLKASDVPLPKLSTGDGGEVASQSDDMVADDRPGWWDRTKSAYKKADEQVELTEFIKSRPKELVKDVVKELIEQSLGAAGKTLTTGYSILSAVKSTSDEVGQILLDAPRAIASTNPDEARELLVRTERVPLNFLNSVFDDVTGKFPPPRYTYHYKGTGNE